MRVRNVAIGGLSLAVAEAGDPESDRHLLLVHGFTGAKEDFTGFLDVLAVAGWHAVAPDLRGHGESDHPGSEDDYNLELFADDLWALVDVLGWERFVLLGHSMGGMISQVAVLRHPERVQAFVLMDTSHGPPEGLDAAELELGLAIVREHGMATLQELMSAREDPLGTPAHQRALAEHPERENDERRNFLAAAPEMWAAMAPAMLSQADRIDALSTLPMPVAVIVGEQDAPFLGPSQRMAKAIPHARLVVIPDAGHSPQFENSDAWWDALTGFLEEVL